MIVRAGGSARVVRRSPKACRMANDAHLEILRQGVITWNQWRQDNPETIPDLQDAPVRRMTIHSTGAQERGLDIRFGSNLRGVNFRSMYLAGANLSEMCLREADFTGANARFADFSGADLTGAVMKLAHLAQADFSHASLDGAEFSQAILGGTVFVGNDLSAVRNLQHATHQFASAVDVQTLYRSKGNISEAFLRGAGVPDNLISYLRSLTGSAFEFYSCFISYSAKDIEFAKRLYADLQASGARCWFAPEHLRIGDRTRSAIDDSIRLYEKLLLVLSRNSVASDWVEKEVETALELERVQKRHIWFPIRLDNAVMSTESGWPADIRRSRNIGNFTRWKDHDTL